MVQIVDGDLVVSPQDIVSEFECSHRVALNAARLMGQLEFQEEEDPALELLKRKGIEHEQQRLRQLGDGLRIKRLGATGPSDNSYQSAWAATVHAMDDEYDVIYQATLFTGDFVGIADFLVIERDEDGGICRDSRGLAVYNPVDAKSARSAKRAAVLQVGAYADALERLGRPRPSKIHLWLAGEQDWEAAADAFVAVARLYREIVQSRFSSLGSGPEPLWVALRESCARCRNGRCECAQCVETRRSDRDISLVQGIHATTRVRLIDGGLPTIDALAQASSEQRPARVAEETFERLRAQAAIQVRGEGQTVPLYEVVNPGELTLLPPRSPGDIWFDMESDPFASGPAGLEYMFGFGYLTGGEFDFATFEAHDAAQERTAFEDFVDEVMRRRDAYPGMHVYHYANYERTALQNLAQQHGTREMEIDLLLKEGRLVDLYRVIQRALRFSTESLSLKDIEAVYGVTHSGEDVSTAMDSVIQYEAYVALISDGKRDDADLVLDKIRSYNRLDCESTMRLDTWLRTLDQSSAPLARDDSFNDDRDQTAESTDPHHDLVLALEAGLPPDPEQRSWQDRGRALLSSALQYHTRERRPAWWELFELIKAEPDELERASDVLLVSEATAGDWFKTPRMRKHRRDIELRSQDDDPRLVLQETAEVFLLYDSALEGMAQPSDSLRGYNSADTTQLTATSVEVTEVAGKDDSTWNDVPFAVLPGRPVSAKPIQDAVSIAAQSVLPENNNGEWRFPDSAWVDLLLSRPPRTTSESLPATGSPIDDICTALQEARSSYVAVQGPPGTGKTFIGARAVARLALQGWRIGVVAQSHAVVDNFLQAVHTFDGSVELGKEPPRKTQADRPWHITSKLDAWALDRPRGYVIGGTAWTFSRTSVRNLQLDLLVIDEAGQFALPNAIACSLAANNVLLLGDPQQLPQVSQAAHPEGIGQSVLEHLISGHATMPSDRGYFLDHTYRMHPEITRAVSHLQYESRLGSAPVTRLRSLEGIPPGIIPTPVGHHDNTTSSPEEALQVVETIRSLLGRAWTDARDNQQQPPRALEAADIIVVAAYNAQVRLIKHQLENAHLGSVAVGTVDKFQGKEAPVVIVSMATSSAEDLPRGLDFLLSPNRLNVAISRAEWASFIIYSPDLLTAQPASVEGLRRLGQFVDLITGPTLQASGE